MRFMSPGALTEPCWFEPAAPLEIVHDTPARVLVVDPAKAFRQPLVGWLSDPEIGRFVIDVADGDTEAVESILTGAHDIYLVDFGDTPGVRRPAAGALDDFLVRGIRQPIIALTRARGSVAARQLDEYARARGADDCLDRDELTNRLLVRAISNAIESRRARDALRAREAELQALVESTRVMPWSLDVEDWSFSYVGPQAPQLLGYPIDAWYQPGFWLPCVHPDDRARLEVEFRSAVDSHRDLDSEFRVLNAEGRVLWMRAVTSAAERRGMRPRLRGFMFDVTDRRRGDEILRLAHKDITLKANELEAANEELAHFATVVSHDLRTPLRTIHNYAEFLLEDLAKTLEDEQRGYLDNICRAARCAETLAADLLELIRVGAGHRQGERVEMSAFFGELARSLELPSDCTVRVAPGMPVVVVDPAMLRMVFQHLVLNGVKFNDSPEKIVEIAGGLREGAHADFMVRDNGRGIPADELESIFGVYRRANAPRPSGSHGLGLPIVRKLVQRMQGWIRVDSRPGEGSTFIVTLPRRFTT